MSGSRKVYTPADLTDIAGTAMRPEQLDIFSFKDLSSIFAKPNGIPEQLEDGDRCTGHLFGNYIPPRQIRMPMGEPSGEYIAVKE